MKNRISILIIAFVMLLSLPVWAGTAGSGSGDQTQTQSRLQDQDQTQDQTRLLDQDQTRDQARLQLRDRLQIADSAKTMQQERRKSLEQAGAGNFTDVQQHWAGEQVVSAYQWGFTNGYQTALRIAAQSRIYGED